MINKNRLAPFRASRTLIEIRARELAFTVDKGREMIAREGIELSGEKLELGRPYGAMAVPPVKRITHVILGHIAQTAATVRHAE